MICMSMTNEELIEELYHKAHQKGFFNELHQKVDEIKKQNPKMQLCDVTQSAYREIKKTKLALPTTQN